MDFKKVKNSAIILLCHYWEIFSIIFVLMIMMAAIVIWILNQGWTGDNTLAATSKEADGMTRNHDHQQQQQATKYQGDNKNLKWLPAK